MPVAPEHAAGGPFYFALSDADAEFGEEHIRYDEYVRSFSLTQNEGDFAQLSVDIKNPNTGLYAPGRKLYVWFSHDSTSSDGGVEPLFRGRMIGIPSDLLGEFITIQFTARPEDLADQKVALAETMKVLPEYDPVFVSKEQRDNPDNVLQGYSKLWHYDRVTHEVTTSDILVGEDGTLSFLDNLYDSLKVRLDSAPKSSVSFDGVVTWVQNASGVIDLGRKKFTGYSAVGIAQAWPKAGQSIGSGWSVAAARVLSGSNDLPMEQWESHYKNGESKHRDGDTMTIDESYSGPHGYSGTNDGITLTQYNNVTIGDPHTGTPASAHLGRTAVVLSGGLSAVCTLSVKYDAHRKREEHVRFILAADIQPVLHPEDSSETNEPIVVQGADVGISVDGSETIPLLNADSSSYFPTDRGLLSLEHLLCRARARLLLGARVGRVTWDVSWEDAPLLTCRKNAYIADVRVSGGAVGKIVEYELRGNGDSGEFRGTVTIACAVGTGAAITTSAGTADYIEDDYIDPDYYARVGKVVSIPSGDIGYSPPIFETGDNLVFPLTAAQVVISETTDHTFDQQKFAITQAAGSVAQYQNVRELNTLKARGEAKINAIRAAAEAESTTYTLTLAPVTGGPFASEYGVGTTILSIPKQLDLAAVV